MLFLAQLKSRSKKVFEIPEDKTGCIAISFSSHIVENRSNIPTLSTISFEDRDDNMKMVILCKDTGIKDCNGDIIYKTPENQLFVKSCDKELLLGCYERIVLQDPKI